LIGCGLWGANILRDLQFLGATVSVVDLDPSARERMPQPVRVKPLDARQLLDRRRERTRALRPTHHHA